MCNRRARVRDSLVEFVTHQYVQQASGISGWWANGPGRWLCLVTFPLADIFLYIVPTIHSHTKMFITGGSFNYIPSAKQGELRPPPPPELNPQPQTLNPSVG